MSFQVFRRLPFSWWARRLLLAVLVCIGFSAGSVEPVFGADDSFQAAEFLPATVVGYVELTKSTEVLSTILDHPIAKHVQTLDVWKKATREEGYRKFLTGRKFFEIQIGSEWRVAIESISSGGLCLAFDGASQGVVGIVKGKDAETMENFRVKILELTRLNMQESDFPEPYRDLPVYKIDKGGAVVVRDWLVVTNNSELGRKVIDRLLDHVPANNGAEGSLAAHEDFKAAYAARPDESVAWGFLDMNAVRKSDEVREALERQAENPLAELLIGGVQSVVKNSPYITGNVRLDQASAALELTSPIQADWVPEHRSYYFGPELKGTAGVLPDVPDTLLTLGTYRDVSNMWLRAGDLFDEQMNDKLAEADSTLSTIFSGKDFGEDILGSFEPAFGIIAARQSFAEIMPTPAIKLPSFALVGSLKSPDTMRPNLRRMFQNAIGFFNIVGAQNGNPQLEMDMVKEGEIDMITSRYLPEEKNAESTTAPIIYNFSPTVAFRGSRFVLSSTTALAKDLVSAEANVGESESNTSVRIFADSLRSVLEDNREQLISQNMLEEGHSREEAETAIGLLLELVGFVKGAGVDLNVEQDTIQLKMNLKVNAAGR